MQPEYKNTGDRVRVPWASETYGRPAISARPRGEFGRRRRAAGEGGGGGEANSAEGRGGGDNDETETVEL